MATPKVFSLFKTTAYEETFPNVSTLGKKVDFFLECSSYDVLIPVKVKGESKLDVFEEAVLKLIDYKSSTAREMADILCLTPDLINFIMIRLQEMDLLQENGKDLTENGRKYIKIDQGNMDEQDIEYAQAKVFVLNQTGEILPYIQKGEFITEPVEDIQGSRLTVEYGTIGNPIRIRGKLLRQDRGSRKRGMLQSSEIRNAFKRYNRIVRENVKYDVIQFASEWAMENTPSDDICFHMQAVVQNGNIDEILISDGFVLNIDFINNYIKKNYPDFILTVKERATRNIVQEGSEGEQSDHKVVHNYKYRELRNLMSRIASSSQLYTINAGEIENSFNQDEQQMLQAEQKKFLLNCYSAFEWSLFYYDLKNPINSQTSGIIENQSAYQNANTILQMALKLGVYHPERYDELFYTLDSKRIRRMYKNTTPELRVALSIAVITSANDEQSAFRQLFRSQPGLFRVLRNLFREHGDLSHQTLTYDIDKVRNKEIYELLLDFVKNLQPDYVVDGSNQLQNSSGSISQERLNAEVSLSKKLGAIYFYNLLPQSIRDEWILVSPDKIRYPETAEFFDILYRIMQDTLFYSLKDIRKNPQLKMVDILSKLKGKGINSTCFNTVNEKFVNQILMNENATLGANAMVYLYYQKDNMIQALMENNFVELIEQLVRLRKHGNNVTLSVDSCTLSKIRDNMLTIAKIIGGN
ncbi:MAG: hypothetical protein Q4G58_04995 [bacterium]|nr:hypothetical protein [bacterium]